MATAGSKPEAAAGSRGGGHQYCLSYHTTEGEKFSSSRLGSFQIRLKRTRSEPIVANF